jgi:hypothetical protein
MKLTFSWRERFERLEPACTSDVLDRDGVSLVSSLLTDTGGLPYLSTLSWLDEGLRQSEAVRCGEAESLRWGREAWGAVLRRDGATLYSLHVEDFAVVMPLDAFEAALRAWIEFIRIAPDRDTTRVVEI